VNAMVYTIPDCPHCSAAKALLKRKGIEFEEKTATVEEFGAAEMPVVMLDNKRTEGFMALKESLK